jgi:thymidylate synthase (FAD)
MRTIDPTFEMVKPRDRETGMNQLRFIEHMARISHRSEDKQTDDSWLRFLTAVVMQKGDWSVVEHEVATVIFRVDRGVTHELVRHRLFSFTQESTRFVNGRKSYPEGLEFISPSFVGNDPVMAQANWRAELYNSEQAYFEQLDMGQPPQIARSLLPNALAATIAVTGNLRNWRHILIMRTTQETHPDFKRIMIPLLNMFRERIPLLFDDIIPNQKQSEALSKPR